ncbi:DUF4097 domain-containing protein [Thalassotalea maritima]|uniref:DUF4097 family beta strand repeat-containing protein n=1 Tax=Thalassotalea maritima TaxID=3242416 RepID=UPI003527960A
MMRMIMTASQGKVFAKASVLMALLLSATTTFTVTAQTIDERKDVAATANIEIKNLRGKVVIIGSEQDEVWVKGRIDEEATNFIFDTEGDTTRIFVKMPSKMNNHWRYNDKQTDLVIQVPQQASVHFTGVSTDVDVSNLRNNTFIKTVSGDVKANNLKNDIQLHSISGDVISDNLSGTVELSSVSGEISATNTYGDVSYQAVSGKIAASCQCEKVKATIVSGDMDIQLSDVRDATVSTVSGDVDAQMNIKNDGLVRMSSVNGDIELKLQKDLNAAIKAHSSGGKIINRINDDSVQTAEHGPSSRLVTRVGEDGAMIKVSTINGKVVFSYH